MNNKVALQTFCKENEGTYLNICCKIYDDFSNSSKNVKNTKITEFLTSRGKINKDFSTTNQQYSMYIMELFDGNCLKLLSILDCKIKSALTIKTKLEYIKIASSIYAQLYMCILMMHKCTGYFHNDAHLGNFFYKKITHKPNEYFHYKFMEQDIYIKNMGYLIVIGDYGWATTIDPDNINYNDVFWDYVSINENIESFKHINIDSVVKKEMNSIIATKRRKYILPDNYSENMYFDILRKNSGYMFYTLNDILKDTKSYKVINDIPFTIPVDYVIGDLNFIIKNKIEPVKSCTIS